MFEFWRAIPSIAVLTTPVGACIVAIAGCPHPAPGPNRPDIVMPDGGQPGDDEDPQLDGAASPACAGACATMKKLGCPEAARPDGGKTCYRVCADAQRTPGISALRPECIAGKDSVEGVRSCGTVRCLK